MNFPVLRHQIERENREIEKPFRTPHQEAGQNYDPRQREIPDRQILIMAGLSGPKLERIETLADKWGVSRREAALSIGAVRPDSYLRATAIANGLNADQVRNQVRLRKVSPPPEPYRLLSGLQPVPLRAPEGSFAINAEDCSPSAIAAAAEATGDERHRLLLIGRAAYTAAIAKAYGPELATRAANGLWQRNPRMSAAIGAIRWQIVFVAVLAGLFAGAVIFAPRETLLVYSALLSVMFLIVIAIRLAAAIYAFKRCVLAQRKRPPPLPDSELPKYSVLVALYKESRILPQLVAGLNALDFPAAKLDIKLILEETDTETIACAHAMDLPRHFEVVIVPDGAPRTKPRALNYALQFSRGDLLVIYDAEDRPDPQQLRKAAAHFAAAGPDVVCLQGQLTFENFTENWLAKQFTIEYASLFDGVLPLLDRLRLPIPLGGTSNHFRIEMLRKLGAWDAYNVTEDADLGMRIYRAGFRAEVLDSETLEEAACQPGNWIRQRTRWLKGWMQTYIVHMRQPLRLLRELGLARFITFQGHFAAIILASLIYPVSYLIIAHDAFAGLLMLQPQTELGSHLLNIAIFNMIAGFLVSFALGVFVQKRRHFRTLMPQIPLIPIYWLFVSAAAYRALYQLVTAPHYWEKTEHFGAVKKG